MSTFLSSVMVLSCKAPLFLPMPQSLMVASHPGMCAVLLCQIASSALSFSSQSTSPVVATYHLQRALPGGIVLMELAFQVRKNKKGVISVGSGTVSRGGKASDEECTRHT